MSGCKRIPVCFGWIFLLGGVFLQDLTAGDDWEEMFAKKANNRKDAELVIAGMSRNYSQIRSMRVELEFIVDNPEASGDGVTTLKKGDGEATVFKPRRVTSRLNCVLRDGALKSEMLSGDGNQEKHVWLFRQDQALQFSNEDHVAWIRGPKKESLPSMFVDPREVEIYSRNRGIIDVLRTDSIEKSGSKGDDLLYIQTKSSQNGNITYTFDKTKNCLPVLIVHNDYRDGSITYVTKVQYREVIGGACWFPDQTVRTSFRQGVARIPECEEYRQRTFIRVLGDVEVNVPVSDEMINVELPDGTHVRDLIHKKSYVHSVVKTEPSHSIHVWLLGGAAMILAIVVVIVVMRRRRGDEIK